MVLAGYVANLRNHVEPDPVRRPRVKCQSGSACQPSSSNMSPGGTIVGAQLDRRLVAGEDSCI